MVLSQCQYKNGLRLEDRLAIAHDYVFLGGYHGLVTELARDHDTNRQRIYTILRDAQEGFFPKQPGPKPENCLRKRIADLEADNDRLKGENGELRDRLQRSIEVTPERLERFLLKSIGEVIPYETIQTQVEASYGAEYVPSVGYLSSLVNHTGTVAGLILSDERVTKAFQAGACDEIFFHQKPVLTVVEPDSMAIGAIEKTPDRTGESWLGILSGFPKLRYVISDLASGLIKGIKLKGNLIHQGDLFHFLYDVEKTTQRLERRFEQMLKQEEEAWDNWCKRKIYTPTLEKILAEVDKFLEKMEQYYQAIERLSEAFYPITDDGRLLTKSKAKRILADVVGRLRELSDYFDLDTLIKQVGKAQLYSLNFIKEVSQRLGRLLHSSGQALTIPQNHLLRLAIREVCLRYALIHGACVQDEYLTSWENLWQLGENLSTFHHLVPKIQKILFTPKLTTSLVESLNSKLRTVQYVKKQVSQEYLWLLALKHNMEAFKHGKRQNHSPFSLLGVDLGTNDWIDLVSTYQP